MQKLSYEEAQLFNLFATDNKDETLMWLQSSICGDGGLEDALLQSLIGKLEKMGNSGYAALYAHIPLDTGY